MGKAEQLFEDYNDYRFKTNHIQNLQREGRYIHSLKQTPERLKLFEEMYEWCVQRGFDSRRWLHSLFSSRRWLFPPKLEHLKGSPKTIRKYEAADTMPSHRNLVRNERNETLRQQGKLYDVNRDLSASAELLKRRYLDIGLQDRCESLTSTETFGYHPRSKECQRCPIASRCAQNLQRLCWPMDVLAVRRGEMTTDEARAVAVNGWSSQTARC